jgi:hypothetical protein
VARDLAPPPEPRNAASAAPAPRHRAQEISPAAAAVLRPAQDEPPIAVPAPPPQAPLPELPDLSELPAPEVVVQRTFWHPDPGKRSALIEVDGRDAPLRVREGDVIGSFLLIAIEPAGVVFMHDGELIRERIALQK